MRSAFPEYCRASKGRVSDCLAQLAFGGQGTITETEPALDQIWEATNYALTNGGKRIRAIMVYAAADAVSSDKFSGALDPIACAIELIHTYSLVHDDLPAMDDDDLRRGKPTLHKAYDEATAILVGDGLQARAFELLADAEGFSAAQRIAMIKTLAAASGLAGMVGGQFVDISSTGKDLTLEQLQAMHALKTGALIRAALAMGGIAAGASAQQLAALDEYGSHIGLAFQVVDDILDVEGDTATLSKVIRHPTARRPCAAQCSAPPQPPCP